MENEKRMKTPVCYLNYERLSHSIPFCPVPRFVFVNFKKNKKITIYCCLSLDKYNIVLNLFQSYKNYLHIYFV